MTPRLVYVSGPISAGPLEHNLRAALDVGDWVRELGHAALIPHLDILWQFVSPHSWEENLAHDEIILERCDALYRVPGDSPGADREMEFARRHDIPVFTSLRDLHAFLRKGYNNGTT